MKPTYILADRMKPFVFVIPPLDLEVKTSQKTERINIISYGEKNKTGKKNVESITFSSFFPNLDSNFYSLVNPLTPILAVETLVNWKDTEKVLTFMIPEFLISKKVQITEFTYSIRERTGDIDFSITLTEYRSQGRQSNLLTGLLERL
jgi:hypothetical protein